MGTKAHEWLDRDLWKKVFRASQQIGAAGIVYGLHLLIDWALDFALHDWKEAVRILKAGSACGFIVIYLILLWHAVAIFLPRRLIIFDRIYHAIIAAREAEKVSGEDKV